MRLRGAHSHFAPHNFTLDPASRELGMRLMGADASFIHKLERRQPVTVVILGASVAQNSGCLDQPGKRCMSNNGRTPIQLVWGPPRKFKGFMVRWFEWMNATWPHSEHRLYNVGRDASSLSTIMPCLFSQLPSRIDLLIVESGSMYMSHAWNFEMLVRQILLMRLPPTIAFFTVHLWCTFGGSLKKKVYSHGLNKLPQRHYRYWSDRSPRDVTNATRGRTLIDPIPNGTNPSDTLEEMFNLYCDKYHINCISQRDALTPGFQAALPGFSIEEIAGDCLHPLHGRLGTEYMTDLLVHWTMKAAMSSRGRAEDTGAEPFVTATRSLPLSPLPPALHSSKWEQHAAERAACYHLGDGFGRDTASAALPWHTGTCSTSRSTTVLRSAAPAVSMQSMQCSSVDSSPVCPSVYAPPGHSLAATMPRVWTFCQSSFSAHKDSAKKVSPGVVAFRPGAMLLIPLPVDWLANNLALKNSSVESRSPSSKIGFNVTLQHQISWHSMGRVRIACTDSCVCAEQVIDAHAQFSVRNVTIFTEHRFGVMLLDQEEEPTNSDASRKCGLSLVMLDHTSSGGHLFKIRDLLLFLRASPCERHASDAMGMKFLYTRSELWCAQQANAVGQAAGRVRLER